MLYDQKSKNLKKAGIEHAAIQTFTPQKEDQNSRFYLKKKCCVADDPSSCALYHNSI